MYLNIRMETFIVSTTMASHRWDQQHKNYVGKNKYLNNDDFPLLSKRKISDPVWGQKSFKEIVENGEIVFDFDILKQKKDETLIAYIQRLNILLEKTTVMYKYNVYNVTNSDKTKTYKVVARHSIIAQLLCYTEEKNIAARMRSEHYKQFKKDTIYNMYNDTEVWDYIMGYVSGDPIRQDEAIKHYHKISNTDLYKPLTNWFSSSVTCEKTEDTLLSDEKVLHSIK